MRILFKKGDLIKLADSQMEKCRRKYGEVLNMRRAHRGRGVDDLTTSQFSFPVEKALLVVDCVSLPPSKAYYISLVENVLIKMDAEWAHSFYEKVKVK
jgi:hypothetical protein